LVAPGLTGFDAMRRIADDRDTALAVMSHPALLGAFTTPPDHGISPGSLYGNICRLAGADVSIFPSFQGRFAFLKDACREIVERTEAKMGEIAPIFPAPAGGMTLDNVPELLEFYGRDAVLVIGGDLHHHGADIVKNCRRFRKLVE
jgi:ribulose-bisphosphate carboxylase large chain